MATVPEHLQCALDSTHPSEPEDYTDWPIDEETEQRLQELESADIHGNEGWDLRGDES